MTQALKWLLGAIVILLLGVGVAIGFLISAIAGPFIRLAVKEGKLKGGGSDFQYGLSNSVKS